MAEIECRPGSYRARYYDPLGRWPRPRPRADAVAGSSGSCASRWTGATGSTRRGRS
jgi:hypothetical protein